MPNFIYVQLTQYLNGNIKSNIPTFFTPFLTFLIKCRWGSLIGYNIFVITSKALLQIPGCIFIQQLNDVCWIVQLFGISCIRKFKIHEDTHKVCFLTLFNLNFKPNFVFQIENCAVPFEDVGLVWDGICFAFLILQLRLFKSYYFCHIINESKASTILASR